MLHRQDIDRTPTPTFYLAAILSLPPFKANYSSKQKFVPMFHEPLDVIETIAWAEKAPRQTNRRSKFLEAPSANDTDQQPAAQLCLPTPVAVHRAKASAIDEMPEIGGFSGDEESTGTGETESVPVLRGADTNLCQRRSTKDWLAMPALIIGYIHTLLNAFVLFAIVYVLGHLLYFITSDIIYKIQAGKEEARALISESARLYKINRCDPTTRVPALEAQCGEWDHIVRNGLSGIKYTKIVLETCADVIDGFLTKFSLRSYAVIFLLFISYLLFRR